MTKLNHMDCRNFIPIDVAKGICHAHGDKIILIDGDDTCPQFDTLPKCKFCTNFTDVDDKGIGGCEGFKVKDWTYSNLKAVTCEKYAGK